MAKHRSHRLSIPIYEELKLAIVDWESQNLDQKDRFFEQRRDCCGVLGYSEDQKMMAALFMMSYGIPSSAVEQYYRLTSLGTPTVHGSMLKGRRLRTADLS